MTEPWQRDWSGQQPTPTAPPAPDVPGYARAFQQGREAAAPKPWERDWSNAAPAPAKPAPATDVERQRAAAISNGQTLSANRPGLWDRIKEVAADAFEYSPVGLLTRQIAGAVPTTETYSAGGDNSLPAQQQRARANVVQAERERRATYEARTVDDPWNRPGDGLTLSDLARGGANVVGMLAGGAAGDPTALIAPGKSLGMKVLGQAAIGGGVDAAVQAGEIGQGVRSEYSPLQTAVTAGLGAGLVGTVEGAPLLREWWRTRGVNVDAIPDEQLVAGSLDGTIGDTGLSREQLDGILRGGGAALDQFSTPEAGAAAAARMQAAQARQPFNFEGLPGGQGKRAQAEYGSMLDALHAAREQGALPARTVPDDVSIIAAPEGGIRSDDAGGIAGVERSRAANASVIEEAQARAAADPVIATILDSNLAPQAKIATIWDRIAKQGNDMPDLPDVPQAAPAAPVSPFNAPNAEVARAPRAQTFMDRVRQRESGGDDAARNGQSSATGRYQFTDATWLQQYKNRFGQTGTDAQILARRNEGALQDTLMRDLTDSNTKALRSGGFEADDGNLYLSHFLGQGGALKTLRAAPDTPIVNIVGRKVVEANRSVLEGKTARDVIAWAHTKMGGQAPAPDMPYRAADFSGSSGTRADPYSFDAADAGTPLRTNGTGNMGVAEVGESAAARAAREAGSGEMATGTSTRPFRAGSADDAEFEARATQQSDQMRAEAQAKLEAEWEAQRQQAREQERSAGDRFERERVRTEDAAAGDPSTTYRGQYDQRPIQDGDFWRLTPEGFVAGKDSRPVAFRSAREAAKWAAANRMGGDFELAVWGKDGRGQWSKRVVLRRRETSTYGQRSPEAAPRSQEQTGTPLLSAPAREAPAAEPATPATPAPAPAPARQRTAAAERTNSPDQVVTARGRAIDTRMEVVEARDLVTSSDGGYDAALQPRDRSGRGSSEAQVARIAGNLDPEQLRGGRLASQGAPIVGADRMVESGNGRVAAIRRAYEQHPERATAYREMLRREGFDVDGMDQPVMIRRRLTDLSPEDRRAWTREANERDTMAMSSTETARADAAAMSDDTLSLFRGGDVGSGANAEFVRRMFRDAVGDADQNALRGPDGRLSLDGKRRIEGALLAKAFDDPDLIRKIVEDPDTNIKAIGTALLDVAPDVARLRADIDAGSVPASLAVHEDIAAVAKLISQAREDRSRIGDVLSQRDAFDPISPAVDALVRAAYNETLTRPRAGPKFAQVLRDYVAEARKADNGPSLFGDAVPPVQKEELIANARRKATSDDLPFEGGASGAGAGKAGDDGAGRSGAGEDRGAASTEDREALDRLFRSQEQDPAAVDEMIAKGYMQRAEGAQRPTLTDEGRALLNPGRAARPDGEAGFITVDALMAPFKIIAKAADIADWKALRGDVTAIRDAFGDPRKAAKSALEPMQRIVSAGVFTNDARLRGLAARFDSDAIRELADHFNAEAGKGTGTGRTYHEAVQRASVTRTQQAFDALEPHLSNAASMDRIRDMLATPNKTIRATPAEREAAQKVRDILKETLEYRRDAGEEIGEVADGYFPRLLNVEKVTKQRERFLERATRVYRSIGLSSTEAAKAAQAWFEHAFDTYAGLDGGLSFARGSSDGIGASTAKAREFGKIADEVLKDFYEGDVMSVLAGYFGGAARRAEHSRRFGAKGRVGSEERKAWDKAHKGQTQLDVLEERIKADVRGSAQEPAGVLQILDSVMRSNLGQMGTRDSFTRNATSYLHTWNQLAKMDRVTISSLGDLTMGIIRGGPRYGFSFLRDHLQETVRQMRKAPPSDAARWAEAFGVANDAFVNQVLTSRAGIEGGTAATQKVLTNFYKAVGLHQFTEGGRIAAAKMAQKMVHDFAHDLVSTSPRIRSRAGLYLRELGISDPEAFGKQLRSAAPTRDDVLADKGFAADYSTAVYRVVQQTILMPSRAEKPTWSAHPVGSMIFSLMSYSYGFKKAVLDRTARLAVQGAKNRDPALMIPAFSLSIMAAFQAVNDTYLRPALFGSGYDFSTESPTEAMMRVADRAGFLGAASPFVNAIKAVRYDRSLAESLSGPVIGSLLNAGQKGIVEPLAGRNSPNTNTSERNAAAALYDAVIDPAVDGIAAARFKGIARSAAILGTGNKRGGLAPGDKSAFVDAVGGEKEGD